MTWIEYSRPMWRKMLEVGQVPCSKPKREIPKDLPTWVKETVDSIEKPGYEERYFCPACGFEVIMPFTARIVLYDDGNIGVGMKNHMVEQYFDPEDGDIHDFDHTIACPFHPHVELITTAYKRKA